MMRKSTRLALLLAFLGITALGFFLTVFDSVYMVKGPRAISSFFIFFDFYTGMYTIVPLIGYLLLIPFVSHARTLRWKRSGFDNTVSLRVGKKEYFKSLIWKSIKDIWFYPVIINLFLILLIVLFVHANPLFVHDPSNAYQGYYMGWEIADWVVYTILEVVGWSLLNMLCMVFSQLVPNKYLYPFTLLIVTLLLTFLVSFLSGLPLSHDEILTALSPFNLLAPGVMSLLTFASWKWRYLTIALAFAGFGLLIYFLYHQIIQWRYRYG